MFEEVCLVCGKDILHPHTAYCSNACADSDWSSSSTCSSPSSTSAEVPPLYTHRASISSTSSISSWSLSSEDLDHQPDHCRILDEDSLQMSYARKPSGTTNQPIVPLLLSRSTSDSYETISPQCRPYASSLPPCFASLAISSKKPSISTTTMTTTSVSPPTPKVPFKLSPVLPAQPQLTTPAPRERGRGRCREESTECARTQSRRRGRRSTSHRSSHSRSLLLDWQRLPSPTTRRGRATADELDGWGSSTFAPGYGTGRSGLVHRQARHGIKH